MRGAEALEQLLEPLLDVAVGGWRGLDPPDARPDPELRDLLLDLGSQGHLGAPARRLEPGRPGRPLGLPGELPLGLLRLPADLADGLGPPFALEPCSEL